jgi:hypothetical protein
MVGLLDYIVDFLPWLIPSADAAKLNLKAVSGYEVVKRIRSDLHTFGAIHSFKIYHDSSNQSLSNLRSELCSSGVTVVGCPSSGRMEAATKMMIGIHLEHTSL